MKNEFTTERTLKFLLKAKVKLIAKIYFENGYKMGIFEYNGRRFNCPLRILRRVGNA